MIYIHSHVLSEYYTLDYSINITHDSTQKVLVCCTIIYNVR